MGQTSGRRLPKPIRDYALTAHNMLAAFSQRAFEGLPQLLLMPNGRRIKWTKKGESHLYDIPPLAYWYNDAKMVNDSVRSIMHVLVEIKYNEQKDWVFTWIKSRTS